MNKENKNSNPPNSEVLLKQIAELEVALEEQKAEKATLLSIVSHDLRSPFNRVFALVNLLKMGEEELNEEHREYLSKMHQVVKDGMWLIRNLLDMRSIEREDIQLNCRDLDLVKFVKSTLRNIKPLADIKGIRFKLSLEAEQIMIKADKQYLTRVLENVLSNAMKFSNKKSSINILVSKKEDEVNISVMDEGPGINAEDQKKMYQKYMPLSTKPTDGESSTGLGLFVVSELLKSLGGRIQYRTKEEGTGSVFEISLPAA